MAIKKADKPAPKMGDVVGSGVLPDGRPYDDVYLDDKRTYRLTRILVSESDKAYDDSENSDGTNNPRLNGRLQLAAAIVQPEGVTIDSFEKLTAVDLQALFRGFNRLNNLPPADNEGNA